MDHNDGKIRRRSWIRYWLIIAICLSIYFFECRIVGTVGVLRAYVSTASAPTDRVKAVAFSVASFTVGISIGPAIPAAFSPIGTNGYFNMYTAPAYALIVLCIVCALVMSLAFVENYAAIVSKQQQKGKTFKR